MREDVVANCEWPGCNALALCSSGNFGGRLVCPDHFAVTNGQVAEVERLRATSILNYLPPPDLVSPFVYNHAVDVANANYRRAEHAEAAQRQAEAERDRLRVALEAVIQADIARQHGAAVSVVDITHVALSDLPTAGNSPDFGKGVSDDLRRRVQSAMLRNGFTLMDITRVAAALSGAPSHADG